MKYCGRYSNKIDMSVFDEITIRYEAQDKQLLTFLEKYADKKITLVVPQLSFDAFYKAGAWNIINAIQEQHPEYNLNVCFFEPCKFELITDEMWECMQKLKVPYYCGNVVNNFAQLHYMFTKNVSEIYVAEGICFDLERAKRACKRYGVQLRAFPNVAQAEVKQTPALHKFFIRPEDVEEYSDCIDTLEFWGPLDRQATLHKIYTKGIWFGDLNDLILDLNLSFDSRRVMPGFAHVRKTCDQKCLKGGACAICDRMLNISKLLEEKELIIKQKKND